MVKKSKVNKNLIDNSNLQLDEQQESGTITDSDINTIESNNSQLQELDNIEYIDQTQIIDKPQRHDHNQQDFKPLTDERIGKFKFALDFAKGGNLLIFLSLIFLILTGLINYKNFFNNYETIVLNEIKDLLFWTRFTLANFLIVSFILFIFGIDLNKAIEEENKFVMLLVIILFVITGFAGQKIFLN